MRGPRAARLGTNFLPRVTDQLEQAVRSLPSTSLCSAELYLALLEINVAHGGRVALVEDADRPVAVLGIRREGRLRWKNFANFLLPGLVGFGEIDSLVPAFAALRREIVVSWVGVDRAPSGGAIRSVTTRPGRALQIADRELFWRSTGLWRNLLNARNRCRDLDLTFDEPGAAEWTIGGAGRKWAGPDGSDTAFITDARVEITRSLTAENRAMTLQLRDGDRRLAGLTCYLEGSVCHAAVLFRDDSIGNLPTGVYLFARAVDTAVERGLATFDMGPDSPYKARWTPTSGTAYELLLSPSVHAAARTTASRIRAVVRRRGTA